MRCWARQFATVRTQHCAAAVWTGVYHFVLSTLALRAIPVAGVKAFHQPTASDHERVQLGVSGPELLEQHSAVGTNHGPRFHGQTITGHCLFRIAEMVNGGLPLIQEAC